MWGCRCVGTYIRVCSVVGVSLKGACMYGLIGVKVGGEIILSLHLCNYLNCMPENRKTEIHEPPS